jgi:hypothetical protein
MSSNSKAIGSSERSRATGWLLLATFISALAPAISRDDRFLIGAAIVSTAMISAWTFKIRVRWFFRILLLGALGLLIATEVVLLLRR